MKSKRSRAILDHLPRLSSSDIERTKEFISKNWRETKAGEIPTPGTKRNGFIIGNTGEPVFILDEEDVNRYFANLYRRSQVEKLPKEVQDPKNNKLHGLLKELGTGDGIIPRGIK